MMIIEGNLMSTISLLVVCMVALVNCDLLLFVGGGDRQVEFKRMRGWKD